MIRTQIYLTETEQQALFQLSRQTGKSKSELVRVAIDAYLSRFSQRDRLGLLRKARGIWQDREDLPDFVKIRDEFDRDHGEK